MESIPIHIRKQSQVLENSTSLEVFYWIRCICETSSCQTSSENLGGGGALNMDWELLV